MSRFLTAPLADSHVRSLLAEAELERRLGVARRSSSKQSVPKPRPAFEFALPAVSAVGASLAAITFAVRGAWARRLRWGG